MSAGPLGDLVAVPDVPEPIRGFRSWTFSAEGLKSFRDTVWPTDEPMKASCQRRSDIYGTYMSWHYSGLSQPSRTCAVSPSPTSADHDGHGCGVYAYRDADLVLKHGWNTDKASVYGEVLLWGKVYEHEQGYRAEFGQVAALYDVPEGAMRPLVKALAEMYGVPLLPCPWSEDQRSEEKARREAEMNAYQTMQQAMLRQVSYMSPYYYATSSSGTLSFDPEPRPVSKFIAVALAIHAVLLGVSLFLIAGNVVEADWWGAAANLPAVAINVFFGLRAWRKRRG